MVLDKILKNKTILVGGLATALTLSASAFGQEGSVDMSVSSDLMGFNGAHAAEGPASSLAYIGPTTEVGEYHLGYSASTNNSLNDPEYNANISGTVSRDFGPVSVNGLGMLYSDNDVDMGIARAGLRLDDVPGSPELGHARDTLGNEYYDASVRFSGEGPHGTEWSARASRMWGDAEVSRASLEFSRDLDNGMQGYVRGTVADVPRDGEGYDATATVGVRREF